MFKTYYQLTKPGIIYGNLLTATGGFLLASNGHIKFGLLIATLSGISLVIASACVFNNYIDRDIDAKMARTKQRALASGLIAIRSAMIFASLLGIIGTAILIAYTNPLTVALGLTGFFVYVFLYGVTKRRTVHGTVVGSISGAMPIVAGYTAVTNRFDTGVIILFLILVCWQMPHFYAIAIYRLNDYKAANIPVLPLVKGFRTTKIQMLSYIVALLIAFSMLTIFGYAGYTYLVIMLTLGLIWLWRGLQGFKTNNDKVWARKMFLFSLIVILSLSVVLSLNSWLP